MAGHSQFANIMHRKGAQDKKRAQAFTRIAREVQAAVKLGGADPANNPRLARALAAGRAENMPKDNLQRAIDKGAGAGGESLEEIRYEGFAPGGVGVIVECLTDNRNRTAGDVRAAFSKNGGNLGETGAVSFLFDRVGEIRYPAAAAGEDTMLAAAVDAGADDCTLEDAQHVIVCTPETLGAVAASLAAAFGEALSVKFVWRAQTMAPISAEPLQTLLKMLSALDDLDDVQAVWTNADIPEEALAALGG